MKLLLGLVGFLVCCANASYAEVKKIEYTGFTVWVDCDKRGPILFNYVAQKDGGSLDRQNTYYLDPKTDGRCQSLTNDTFNSHKPNGAPDYDVGHMVPANHFDHDEDAIYETNYWTNLLPQTKSMNRGAWLQTEYAIECHRDVVDIEVWGGPIWGSDTSDDYFVQSHGVETPSAFWKIAIRTDNREAMSWVIPNGDAPTDTLDDWVVSVSKIETVSGRVFNAVNKTITPTESWKRLPGCSVE